MNNNINNSNNGNMNNSFPNNGNMGNAGMNGGQKLKTNISMNPLEQTDCMLYNNAFFGKPTPKKGKRGLGVIFAIASVVYLIMGICFFFSAPEIVILVVIFSLCAGSAALSVKCFKPGKDRVKEFLDAQSIYRGAFERKQYICEKRTITEKFVEQIETGSDDSVITLYKLKTNGGVVIEVNYRTYDIVRVGDFIYEVYADFMNISPFRYLERVAEPGHFACLQYGTAYLTSGSSAEKVIPQDIKQKYNLFSNEVYVQQISADSVTTNATVAVEIPPVNSVPERSADSVIPNATVAVDIPPVNSVPERSADSVIPNATVQVDTPQVTSVQKTSEDYVTPNLTVPGNISAFSSVNRTSAAPVTQETCFGKIQLSDGYILQEIERKAKKQLSESRSNVFIILGISALVCVLGIFVSPEIYGCLFFTAIPFFISIKQLVSVSSALSQAKRNRSFWCENLKVTETDKLNGHPRVKIENNKFRFHALVSEEELKKIPMGTNAIVCGVGDYNAFLISFLLDSRGLAMRVELSLK